MENKKQPQAKANGKSCQSSDLNRKTDIQVNKPWPRNTRRREQLTTQRNDPQRNPKQNTSAKVRLNVDKRPRPRGGGNGVGVVAYHDEPSCDSDDIPSAGSGLEVFEYGNGASKVVAKGVPLTNQLDSVHVTGSKKRNLNHLLNFHYAPREGDYFSDFSVFGRDGAQRNHYSGAIGKKPKYNKEQFLQANFQFVIKMCAKPKLNASPDALIAWDFIEQINIQTTEEPQCPICLYPPIAAKMTRCGHAYCWPCILHYLALSDKSWRKCPICYEAVHIADLKSTTIVQQREMKVDEQITFHLMRRKKDSMFVEKFKSSACSVERYPHMSSDDNEKLFSKFVIATRADILDIIEREQRELMADDDASSPDFVFIQQALDLLKDRREKLGEIQKKEKGEEIVDIVEKLDTAAACTSADNIDIDNASDAAPVELNDIDATEDISNAFSAIKHYYFYQSDDGQNIYLHPINVKMLQANYGTLDYAPLVINARILQKEHHSMDEMSRRKFTCLGHLPLTCQFAVVEVDLKPPIITSTIMELFQDEVNQRKKERQRRDRDERKREKKINEINDRQMGKILASTAKLNLNSAFEFPTFEEFLPIGDNATAPMATPNARNHHATYSAVTVDGDSPKMLWPVLATPANSCPSLPYSELVAGNGLANAATHTVPTAAALVKSQRQNIEPVDEADGFKSLSLGDVLAEAMVQKQNIAKATTADNNSKNQKQKKKSKKMQPIFSTSMNFNGN